MPTPEIACAHADGPAAPLSPAAPELSATWDLDAEATPPDPVAAWIGGMSESQATQLHRCVIDLQEGAEEERGRGTRERRRNWAPGEQFMKILLFVERVGYVMPQDSTLRDALLAACSRKAERTAFLAALATHIDREGIALPPLSLAEAGSEAPLANAVRSGLLLPLLERVAASNRSRFVGPTEDRRMLMVGGGWALPFRLLERGLAARATCVTPDEEEYRALRCQEAKRVDRCRVVFSDIPRRSDPKDPDDAHVRGDIVYLGHALALLPKPEALRALSWAATALFPGGILVVASEAATPDRPSPAHMRRALGVRDPSPRSTGFADHLRAAGMDVRIEQPQLRIAAATPGGRAHMRSLLQGMLPHEARTDTARLERYLDAVTGSADGWTYPLHVIVARRMSRPARARPPEHPRRALEKLRTQAENLRGRLASLLSSQQRTVSAPRDLP